MSEPVDPTTVRVNIARGLCSLLDRGADKITRQVPSLSVHALVLADMLKQRICESAVLTQDMSALDLARRVGLVEPAKPAKRKRRLHPKNRRRV